MSTLLIGLKVGQMIAVSFDQMLFLSVRTIEAHLRSIYSKLNVASRTEAALWAVKNGFAPQL